MQTAIDSVLLVDDDPDDAFLMERALKELGYPVRFYFIDDSDAVPAALVLHRPGLIFTDINMPRRTGLECLRDWRAGGVLSATPVVIYSASEGDSLVQEAYGLGAALYFRKPATFTGLVESLRTILAYDWSDPAAVRTRHDAGGHFEPFGLVE
ncbi:response regulator [Flaviaesturariibacter flavus]|uniref:Response regulator n=1 Tax=Flaviaesturariibacter flavus TaxID=2502780 RepID=A0A4R1BN28_9BACT|nr:response regulator [Flaviaesturariibacter flavus]TCJ18738.1 response regulator [Flaviaesturariibacter flavus]